MSVEGAADGQSGMILARPVLDRIVERVVLSKIDHADLNSDVEDFRDVVPHDRESGASHRPLAAGGGEPRVRRPSRKAQSDSGRRNCAKQL